MEELKSNDQAGKAGASGVGGKDLPSREKFDRLRKLANEGDQDAQSRLRKFLDQHEEICEQLGNMADHAQASLIRQIAGDDFVLAEAIRRKAAEMRRELAGAFPTPLEILGAERVVASWLQLQWVQSACERVEGDIRSATFWLKRQGQAEKLYHAAIRSLLLMRTLLPAAVRPVLGLIDRDGTAAESVTSNGRINGHGSGRLNGNGEAHISPGQGTFNRVTNPVGNGTELEPTTV